MPEPQKPPCRTLIPEWLQSGFSDLVSRTRKLTRSVIPDLIRDLNTLDVGTTDFDLSDEKKAALIEQGIQGAESRQQA